MTYSKKEAEEILAHLLTIESEVKALLIDGSEENEGMIDAKSLTNRLTTLKDTLKKDSKRLKSTPVKKLRVLQTGFLRPALNQAFNAFTMRANTRPFSKKWNRGLNDVLSIVVYHREKLQELIADL